MFAVVHISVAVLCIVVCWFKNSVKPCSPTYPSSRPYASSHSFVHCSNRGMPLAWGGAVKQRCNNCLQDRRKLGQVFTSSPCVCKKTANPCKTKNWMASADICFLGSTRPAASIHQWPFFHWRHFVLAGEWSRKRHCRGWCPGRSGKPCQSICHSMQAKLVWVKITEDLQSNLECQLHIGGWNHPFQLSFHLHGGPLAGPKILSVRDWFSAWPHGRFWTCQKGWSRSEEVLFTIPSIP